MDSGFIVDFTYGTHGSEQSSWVKGTAEPSFWTGWTALKLSDKQRLPIVTFRCPACGQLKSFAQAI
jgi:hypothetical protein